jgi:hypothetical protein
LPAILALTAVAGGIAVVGAPATPNGLESTCTAAQKSQRQAALAAYKKRIGIDRRAYFARHKSATLRGAFRRQQARLKQLQTAAACTISPAGNSAAARLARLRSYADQMRALTPLFDPALMQPADDALSKITDDEDTCSIDPEADGCPLPASEYQETARILRDAAAKLKQLATKLAPIVPPPMKIADYDEAASDCGVDLVTLATAHRSFLEATNKWVNMLGSWADTYAALKSVDFSALEFTPGADSVADEPHEALVVWAVMVSAYWNSLAKSPGIASAPPVPAWISSLNDEECGSP